MSKWQYESDITPSTITITDLVNQDWVMRITPDRRIEVNEDVEVTEAAQKVLDVIQEMMDRQKPAQEPYKCHWVEKGKGHCERNNRMGLPDVYTHPHQWQGLTDDEIEEIIGESIESMYSGHYNGYRAIEAKLKEKNNG